MIKTSKAMKRYIHIKKEDREFIMKVFKITQRTVFNAIHFEDMNEGNDLAKKIRTLALERGGIIMVEVPEGELFHDSDNYMREYLPGKILIELSKTDGCGVVFKNGVRMRSYKDVLLTDIPSIQAYAAGLK